MTGSCFSQDLREPQSQRKAKLRVDSKPWQQGKQLERPQKALKEVKKPKHTQLSRIPCQWPGVEAFCVLSQGI